MIPLALPIRRPARRLSTALLLAAIAITTASQRSSAQSEQAGPDWYDKEQVDAWARNLVALLNTNNIEEAEKSVPYGGIYEIGIVPMVGDQRDDPEVLAYLKQFYPTFASVMRPKGGDELSLDFMESGVEAGFAYILLRTIPRNKPKSPEFGYLQLVIEKATDGPGYLINDVFPIRTDASFSRICKTLFVLLMPDTVFQKIDGWDDSQRQLHAQREAILAIFGQARKGDPTCIDSFLALDPPRPDDVVLLDAVSKAVFENTDDPEQIKKVLTAWKTARPRGICMLMWHVYGMRRLGGQGYVECNRILDILIGIERYAADAYLDVLGAENELALGNLDAAEQRARRAIEKEANLFVARHVLHLVLTQKGDFDGIAESLKGLATIDPAFTADYVQTHEQLGDFRASEIGQKLLGEIEQALRQQR